MANPELWDGRLLKKEHVRKAKRPRQSGTTLPYSSEKQALLNERWAGIKEGIIAMQRKYEVDGKAHCESCGIAGNEKTLDLHHLRSRAQGGEYEARNGQLLCNRFNTHGPDNCHDRETGQVQWSERV